MNKYHKNIHFPIKHQEKLKSFTDRLNNISKFSFTSHARENVLLRINDLKYFYEFMLNLSLADSMIFEYVINDDIIEKVVYRINYDDVRDIIISVTENKKIVTLYFNNVNDAHVTLRNKEYINK